MCTCLGLAPFSALLLFSRSFVSTPAYTLCLPAQATTSPLPHHFKLKVLLNKLSGPVAKMLLPNLVRWTQSLPNSLLLSKNIPVIKNKTLLWTPDLQPLIDLQDTSTPPALPCKRGGAEKSLSGPLCPWISPLKMWSHCWNAPCLICSITGGHGGKCGWY